MGCSKTSTSADDCELPSLAHIAMGIDWEMHLGIFTCVILFPAKCLSVSSAQPVTEAEQ